MQRRTADHIVDVPVLHILEEIVEVVRLVPEERVQQRTDEQTVDEQLVEVPFTQILEEIGEEFKIGPQEQFSERISEQKVNVPVPEVDVQKSFVPPIMEDIADVVQCTPQDVATGETDLQGEKLEIVATGETGLEAREETSGRVCRRGISF